MVNETVIQLDDQQYWLYAAVDPYSYDLLYTQLEPTRTNVIAEGFFTELREKHDVDGAVFLVDGATPLQEACTVMASDSAITAMGITTALNVYFVW